MERVFRLREHGSTVCQEVAAGVASFATASFILVVNPALLGACTSTTAVGTTLAS